MKKIGAETILLGMLLPIVLGFGSHLYSKVDKHDESIITLESSRNYTEEDIREIKDDLKETKRDLKEMLNILREIK
jgi:hypothetical protein